MSWRGRPQPPVPHGGMVERMAARYHARFDEWPPTYLVMVKNVVPPHVVRESARWRASRFWEDQEEKPQAAAPAGQWDWLEALTKKESKT